MKKLLMVVMGLVAANAHAQVQPKMETGHYQGVDAESGVLKADLILNADKSLVFKLVSEDFEIPEPGCTGNYVEIENELTSDVTCPMDFLTTAKVKLDITAVTPETIRAPSGVDVPVYVDALGEDPIIFKLRLIEDAVIEPIITPVP